MKTTDMIHKLKEENFILNYEYIRYLIRNDYLQKPIRVRNAWVWEAIDIERLRIILIERGKLKPS